ncbi:DUF1800 domain-containing protein [Rhizobium oryzicola]|uniref:DUF1800 family protein n=1 Tax=Rhizobium oryzicola TaxID=1232668 RepID=A0ABT8T207_9HYPH|nr:DUF1800 family protein [Rhizobium oryzicola]MDO1584668.1 DUF1800 family protein [Rhizobium oryzicola]
MTPSFSTIASRRFGYGMRPGEDAPDDVDDMMAQLPKAMKSAPRFPREGITGRRETAGRLLSVRAVEAKAALDGRPNVALRKETQKEADRIFERDALGRITQAVYSPYGFYERLATFWMDHFAVNARKVYETHMIVPLFEAEAIRPNLAGPFSKLLKAAILHPAMLIYLDQERVEATANEPEAPGAPALNETLGRDLLDLHTMGADAGYSVEDLRGVSFILAGLSVDNRSLEIAYRPRGRTNGMALFGRTYTGGSDDHQRMLEDLAVRPETARFICRKLVSHFISDDPPAEVVEPMLAAWTESNGDLTRVYRAMLDQPRAWSGEMSKVIPPFDFVVTGLRAFELKPGEFQALAKAMESGVGEEAMPMTGKGVMRDKPGVARALTIEALKRMGQPVWQPPSPAGFSDRTDAWLSPGQISERIGWARMAARALGRDVEPEEFVEAALGDGARDVTRELVLAAPTKVHALTLALASPEFNRR